MSSDGNLAYGLKNFARMDAKIQYCSGVL